MTTTAQHAAQQRPFSPLQSSPPPNTPGGISLPPPVKKPKISPTSPPSQPASPYVNSGYAGSPQATTPGAIATPTTNFPSPAPQGYHNPQTNASQVNSPYQQTRPPNSLPMPTVTPVPPPTIPPPNLTTPQPPHQTPVPPPVAPYSTATLVPAHLGQGDMGPPSVAPSSFSSANNDAQKQQGSKPAPAKGSDYDMNDMLAGTGINLDEEAEKLNDFEIREGFPHHPPGGKDSFYGAGPANQPAQHTDARSPEELAAEAADEAWNAAARNLAIFRTNEMLHPFLEPGILHKRLQNRAIKYGLTLNDELKPDGKNQYVGKLNNPADFPKPEIIVSTKEAADGTMVETHGSFIPHEAYLLEQIALLSLATKEHVRTLIGEANRISTTRQQTTHGTVPTEWIDAAALQQPSPNDTQPKSPQTGTESAVSPRAKPLKRKNEHARLMKVTDNEITDMTCIGSADEISNGLPTPVSEASSPNFLVEALEDVGKETRNLEEGRLKKRMKRQEKSDEKKDGEDGGSRAGSVAPGTPGSVAPEGDAKPMTKKESKKAAKQAEISSTTVNQTLSMFAGGKKKKRYSWMTGGAPGSGAATPRQQGAGQPGTPGGPAGSNARAARGPLTRDSAHRLGSFREDSKKGKNIQLRDFIAVLEDREIDPFVLQSIYDKLDKSDFGDKMHRSKT